jgi:7-cyano-7-deazaguanine synthase
MSTTATEAQQAIDSRDTVIIYSGGMDSYTLLREEHFKGRIHSALAFYYGQRHRRELECVIRVCYTLAIHYSIIDLWDVAACTMRDSALTNDRHHMPVGHYADESMKKTVVPNRNMIMLSIAIAYAVSNQLKRVVFGAHTGDHTIYPDCRPGFVIGMNSLAAIANWHPVRVEAPYLHLTKAQILARGIAAGVERFAYLDTWTCYEGGRKACGQCGSCTERLEAFAAVDWEDPLSYVKRS